MNKAWDQPGSAERARHRSHMSRRELLGLLGAGAGLGLASAVRGDSARPPNRSRRSNPPATVAFPEGAVIRTVLKDVSPATLGMAATLFHEHLSFEWARVRPPNGRGT